MIRVQAGLEPDLALVAGDGRKVPAHRAVLVLHSRLIQSVLAAYPAHLTPR